MKLSLRDIKKALYVCSILAFLVGIHVASVYVFAVHRFSVDYDPLLSATAERNIDTFIRETALHTSSKASEIVQKLQEKFPFIRSVICRYHPGSVHIALRVHEPLLRLNNDGINQGVVVTANNRCVQPDYFEQFAYVTKPNLYVVTDNFDQELPEDVFAYLASIDQTLLTQSSIDWRHRNEIVFHLAHMPVRMMCNYNHKVSQKLIGQCDEILASLAQKPPFRHGICADVRFDDRIIVSKLKS